MSYEPYLGHSKPNDGTSALEEAVELLVEGAKPMSLNSRVFWIDKTRRWLKDNTDNYERG